MKAAVDVHSSDIDQVSSLVASKHLNSIVNYSDDSVASLEKRTDEVNSMAEDYASYKPTGKSTI